jgi:tetratricopeptide (TPR) repeat protein
MVRKKFFLITSIIIFLICYTFNATGITENEKEKTKKWFSEGQKSLAYKNYDEAIKYFKKILNEDPSFIDVHRFLGDAYFGKGELEKAKNEYKQVIIVNNPNNLPGHIGLGNVYFKEGKLEKARTEYEKAIAINADCAPAHSGLGDVYIRKQKTDAAVSEYTKAIMLDPDQASAYFNLATIYLEKGKNPYAANLFYRAGVLYYKQGNKEMALKSLQYLKKTDSKKLEQLLLEKLLPILKTNEM